MARQRLAGSSSTAQTSSSRVEEDPMNCSALVLQAWSNPQRPTPSWGPHRTAHTPQINAAVLWPQGCRPLQPRASRVHPTTLPTGFSALPVLRNLGQRRHGKHPFFALSPCTRRTCKGPPCQGRILPGRRETASRRLCPLARPFASCG